MSTGPSYTPPPGRQVGSSAPGQRRDQPTVTANMVQYLDQTRPWVRFLSVLMFIGLGFMILGALFVLVAGASMSKGMPTALLSVVYLLLAGLYAPPAVFLWKYATAIKSMDQRQAGGMEEALQAQKSFWRYIGILSLVVMIIYAIGLAVVVVVGIGSRL